MAFLLFKANPNRGTLDSILLSGQGFGSSPPGGSPSFHLALTTGCSPRAACSGSSPFRQTRSTSFGLSRPHTLHASLLRAPDNPLRLPTCLAVHSRLAGQLWSPGMQCPASEPHQPHPLSLVTFQSLGLHSWPSALPPVPGAKGIFTTLNPGNHADPSPGLRFSHYPFSQVSPPPKLNRFTQDTKH